MPEVDPTIYQDDRVIYKKLPGEYAEFFSYDALTDSAYLVQYWELQQKTWNRSILNFLNFSSQGSDLRIFTEDQIDALAVYFGFEGDFYNIEWSKESKIKLMEGVYKEPFIWKFRGNRIVFEYVLNCLEIEATLTRPNGFIVGIDTPGEIIGSPEYNEYVLIIPDEYQPNTEKYGTVIWVVERFIPFWVKLTIEHESNYSD